MKKIINVKEIMIILISVLVITMFTTNVFATDPLVLVDPDEYGDALEPEVEEENNSVGDDSGKGNNTQGNNTQGNNTQGNNTKGNNTKGNNTKVYNTNNTNLPQTGIEDYNVGVLMIICVASAIYAYRKINDYRNI